MTRLWSFTAVAFFVTFRVSVANLRQGQRFKFTRATESPTTIVGRAIECPEFTEFYNSDIVVEFSGCPQELNRVALGAISFQIAETYNALNSRTARNSETCDPFFREILSAVASSSDIGFELARGIDLIPGQRRYVETTDFVGQENNEYSFWLEGFDRTGSSVPAQERQESDGCSPQFFKIRFQIMAQCRGCDVNKTRIFDERRTVSELEEAFGRRPQRSLVELPGQRPGNAASVQPPLNNVPSIEEEFHGNCPRCPLQAERRAITQEEMAAALNQTLQSLTESNPNLIPNLNVDNVIEVRQVPCIPLNNNFTSHIDMSFSAKTPRPSKERLASTFARSYNKLADERFCDPYFRKIRDVEVANLTMHQVERNLWFLEGKGTNGTNVTYNFTFNYHFSYNLYVTGVCRGCPSHSSLFDDAARRSLLAIDAKETNEPSPVRFLQGEKCYCAAVNSLAGAPSRREFSERFETDVMNILGFGTNQLTVDSSGEKIGGQIDVTLPTRMMRCQTTADCGGNKPQVCVSNRCIHDGNPRITLTWDGDDDLDLLVVTPDGATIWYDNNFDPVSLGAFDTGHVQDIPGKHVESIYFPLRSAPQGVYQIWVSSFKERGEPDSWTVEVFSLGSSRMVVTGQGELDQGIQYAHSYRLGV